MIPVHNHSEFSALDGYSTAEEIAARIRELGLSGAFLTDHGNVAGFPDFRKAMGDDLFVGYGMEAYQARYGVDVRGHEGGRAFRQGEDAFHLVLLAADPTGYENLLRISDAAHRDGFYYFPRTDLEMLRAYREGLIATTACMGSLVNQQIMNEDKYPALDDLLRIFGDDLYVELHTYDTDEQRELNKALVEIAKKKGLRLLYANDAHYASKDKHEIHEVLLCAQMGEKVDAEKGRKVDGEFRVNHPDHPTWHHPPCLYIMSEKEVRKALSNLPAKAVDEAISNSDELVNICDFVVERTSRGYVPVKLENRGAHEGDSGVSNLHLPSTGKTVSEFLDEVDRGIERRYGFTNIWEEAGDRAADECEALIERGLWEYFLIVQDYIEHSRSKGWMVGPGRGSVGGSIVAYSLGITNICPLRFDLPFERFWNKDRASGLPDIDTDFMRSHRQDMLAYAREKWGGSKVLPIGNHIRLRPRSALIKTASVLGFEKNQYQDLNTINRIIDKTDDAGQAQSWETIFDDEDADGIVQVAREELRPWILKYPQLFATASQLSGRLSTYGVHASAVVIADVDLPDQLPGRSAAGDAGKRQMVTQYEMHQVEDADFPKFDFLGLNTLDMLTTTATLAGVEPAEIIPLFEELEPDDIPEEAYEELLDEGNTLGLFQIDTNTGAQDVAMAVRPRCIEDLAAIVALNRPGPLRSGAKDKYVARKAIVEAGGTHEPDWYVHPLLEQILRETYGVFLYQEQVMGLFTKVLGYPGTYGDEMRKIVGKKLIADMEREKPRYLEACEDVGIDPKTAEQIWTDIQDFSRYGFNKAHAVGYGMMLAWTLYAKHRWPTEFIMAGMQHNPDQVADYVNEAVRMGVKVLPPDINRSQVMISKTGDAEITYGLRDIKGIGAGAARWIVDNGPWEDPYHLLVTIMNAEKPPCNLGHFKSLSEAGATDWLGYRLVTCDECDGRGRISIMVPKVKGDGMKRATEECPKCEGSGFMDVDLPDTRERAKMEKMMLGIVLTDTTSDLREKYAAKLENTDTIRDAQRMETGERARVAGVVTDVKKFKVRADAKRGAGQEMARVTITWEGDTLAFVAFPDTLDEYGFALKENAVGIFTLNIAEKGPNLKAAIKLT